MQYALTRAVRTHLKTVIKHAYSIVVIDDVLCLKLDDEAVINRCETCFNCYAWLEIDMSGHNTVDTAGKNEGRSKSWNTISLLICSTPYRKQKRLTFCKVDNDWHKPTIPQRIMRLSVARANKPVDLRCSAQTYRIIWCPSRDKCKPIHICWEQQRRGVFKILSLPQVSDSGPKFYIFWITKSPAVAKIADRTGGCQWPLRSSKVNNFHVI